MLIKSISGIRGTIGGKPGSNLTPLDIVKFVTGFGLKILQENKNPTIIVGRDARVSGEMTEAIVLGTLVAMGINVKNIGLATTPTVEIAVIAEKADGGIIITASHNPENWNALKLLNARGEFFDAKDAAFVLEKSEQIQQVEFVSFDKLGKIIDIGDYSSKHIELIKKLNLVDTEAIAKRGFKIAIDCINSVASIAVVKLLESLGVKEIVKLNCDTSGLFNHNPEPLEKNLGDLMHLTRTSGADVGFALDPDVDRLAIISEDGTYFGEEYTLVAVADYVLQHTPGNTVSNLSSSMALKEITEKYGGKHFASAVGEVNVIEEMKKRNAVIGGEGNGGVIYPALHYGRDALVGIALILSYLAKENLTTSQLRKKYPFYPLIKRKINIENSNPEEILEKIKHKFSSNEIITIDGVKILFDKAWVHIRKSNTEPVLRIYAEAETEEQAIYLTELIYEVVKN